MTSTDDVLAQIDSAMEDWTISGDAMRSRPEAVDQPEFRGCTPSMQIGDEVQAWIAPAGTDPGDDGWQPLGVIGGLDLTIGEFTIDPEAVAPQVPTVNWDEVREHLLRIQAERARRMQQMFEAIRQAFGQLAAPLAQAAEAFQHLPEAEDCDDCGKPPRPRDRPAWQSTYGPAYRRRR
ncbi:hypothetical protein [Streptomyces sp. NPDC058108]|uniref:hypothetical protein n=1 Tax=Streptomyces sp. NPDC058108 TaxID=3346344 RepID=UPI0036E8348B